MRCFLSIFDWPCGRAITSPSGLFLPACVFCSFLELAGLMLTSG